MNIHRIKNNLFAFFLLFLTAGTAQAVQLELVKADLCAAGRKDTLVFQLKDNTFAFTSFQLDVTLPDGILMDGKPFLAQEMADGHTLSWENQQGNEYRGVVYSLSNKNFKSTTGTLLSIPVQLTAAFKDGEVKVTKGLLANQKSGSQSISDYTATVSAYVQKQSIVVNVYGLEQKVNPDKAAVISYTVVPESVQLQESYYKDAALKDEATEEDRKNEGVFYVKLSYAGDNTYDRFEAIYVMNVTSKVDIPAENITVPTASTLVKGQLLSQSILSGGSATDGEKPVPGQFIWTNGNTVITTSGEYAVTFIPTNQTYYNTKEVMVKVEVIPTYLITALAEDGGSIQIHGKSSDNLYTKDQKITLTAVPDANYKFSGWKWNGTNTTGGETLEVSANEDGTYTASFAPIMHNISWNVTGNGTIQVSTDVGNINNNTQLQQGTTLQVVATPDASAQLASLRVNGSEFTTGSLKVQGEVKIDVVFEQKPVDMYSVTIEKVENGSVLIYQEDGTPVLSGSTLPVNTKIKVITLPAAGYQVDKITLNGNAYANEDLYTVTQNVSAKATFAVKQYKVTAQALNVQAGQSASGEIVLDKSGNLGYGEIVKIKEIKAQPEASLLYILANGKEISPYEEMVVTGDLTVTAVFDHRVDIKKEYIMWPHQSYYYNGVSRNFVPFASQTYAGFSFEVLYQRVKDGKGQVVTEDPIERAIDAGEYNVLLHRDEDGLYNKFDETYEEGLVIHQSKVLVTKAPADANSNPETRPSETMITKTTEGSMTTKYIIGPKTDTDKNNYQPTTYYYSTAPTTTVNFGNTSSLRSAETEEKGYVRITNGGLPYDLENGKVEIPQGITVEVEAVPAPGYIFARWADGTTSNPRSCTVGESEANLTPTFTDKPEIAISGLAIATSEYDGTAKTVTVNGADELCQISFFADEACTQPVEMKNAGSYYVRVYRPENETYKEFSEVYTYTISQATPKVVWPTASIILAGQPLSAAELQGGEAGLVAGSFAWSNPEQVLNETASCKVLFTSLDPNYKSIEGNVKVEVLSFENGEPTEPEKEITVSDNSPLTNEEGYTSITFIGTGSNILTNVTSETTIINQDAERILTLSGEIDLGTLTNNGTVTLVSGENLTMPESIKVINKGTFTDKTGWVQEVSDESDKTLLSVEGNVSKYELEEGKSIILTANASSEYEDATFDFNWQKQENGKWVNMPEQKTRVKTETNQITVSEAGKYRCLIKSYSNTSTISTTLLIDMTVSLKSSPEDPDPDPQPVIYQVSKVSVCEGANLRIENETVRKGGSVNLFVSIDKGYNADKLKVLYQQGKNSSWQELKESTTAGKYTINNIQTNIYVKVEGVVKEEATGIEEVEGVKVYTKDGSLFVQTPQHEQVIVISMTGAVVKNEEQIGLKQYHGLNPGIYVVRVGDKTYKLRLH